MLGFQMTTAVTFGPVPTGEGTWIWGWLVVLTGPRLLGRRPRRLAPRAVGLDAGPLPGDHRDHRGDLRPPRHGQPELRPGHDRLPVHPALVPEPSRRSRRRSASSRSRPADSDEIDQPKRSRFMEDRSLDELGPVDYLIVEFPAGQPELHGRGGGRAAPPPRCRDHPDHGHPDPDEGRGRLGRSDGAIRPARARRASSGSRPSSPRPWPRTDVVTPRRGHGSGQRGRRPRLREPVGRSVRIGHAPGRRSAHRQRPHPRPGPHRRRSKPTRPKRPSNPQESDMPLGPGRAGVGVIGAPVAKTAVVGAVVTPGPVAGRQGRRRRCGRDPGTSPVLGARPLVGSDTSLGRKDAEQSCPGDRLGPAAHVQLRVDVADVDLHRERREE